MKKTYYWIIAAVIVALLVGRYIYAKRHQVAYTVAYTVAQQDVRQTVLATGTVTSQSNLNLSFKNTGNLAKLNVQVGDQVHQGQILAMLDEKDAAAAINQAKAQVLAAQASYNKLLNGASSADIDVAKAAVTAAQVALDNAKTASGNTVAQQKIAVSNALSAMLNAGLAAQPGPINNTSAAVTISGTYGGPQGSYTLTVVPTGSGNYFSVSGIEQVAPVPILRGVAQPIGADGLYVTFGTSGAIFPNDTWTVSIPNTQAATYLAAANAYQAALVAQTQAVSAAQGAVDTAQAQLANAQAQLELKQSAARPEDIQAAQAQVQQAQAQLQTANNTFQNNTIVAPIDGVITSVDAKIGEQVAPQKEVLILLDQNSLHVESNISESSIALIKPGQSIDMTLDAFGPDRHFAGQVLSIDPASTVVQGVINYRVVSSIPNDQEIKPGMTVNLTVQIADKPNVLAVPNRLIKSQGDRKFVTIVRNGKPADVDIQTGAVGDNFTEVTGGLNSGDKIVNDAAAK